MVVSMTGFGKAEAFFGKKKYSIEIRSVNNRFSEISFKYPKFLSSKDFELKEIVRKKITRGKLNINLAIEQSEDSLLNLYADENLIKEYFKMLKRVNEIIGSKEDVRIEHILNFTDLFLTDVSGDVSKEEFDFICKLLDSALDDLIKMKEKEGNVIKKDMLDRIRFIEKESSSMTKASAERIKAERKKIKAKVEKLLSDKKSIDENRLEQEIILLTEKIDITEEVIRLKSHTKYFIEYSKSPELAGRRLNFLIQEINREVNTIASKSMDAEVSQKAVVMKEELEKVREQLQNVE